MTKVEETIARRSTTLQLFIAWAIIILVTSTTFYGCRTPSHHYYLLSCTIAEERLQGASSFTNDSY